MKLSFLSALLGLTLAAAGFTAASAAERVVFMTDWLPEAEQGGFYEAAALGLYAKRGLDVQIRSGGSGADPQQLMAAGAVDMAIGSSSFFALNLVKAGAPEFEDVPRPSWARVTDWRAAGAPLRASNRTPALRRGRRSAGH